MLDREYRKMHNNTQNTILFLSFSKQFPITCNSFDEPPWRITDNTYTLQIHKMNIRDQLGNSPLGLQHVLNAQISMDTRTSFIHKFILLKVVNEFELKKLKVTTMLALDHDPLITPRNIFFYMLIIISHNPLIAFISILTILNFRCIRRIYASHRFHVAFK